MKMLTEEELNKRAGLIAGLILKTDTDQRNVLYDNVAMLLRKENQSYTATLFESMARCDRGG